MKNNFGMDWKVKAWYGKRPLNGEEIREFIKLDPEDLENVYLEADTFYIGDFSTTKAGAVTRLKNAAEQFTKSRPIIMEFYYHYDGAWNPDGFVYSRGYLEELTGEIIYRKENGLIYGND